MGKDEDIAHHPHGDLELCAAAVSIYTEALSAGRVPRTALEPAPCLTELALVHPDPQDNAWMRPVPPSAALAHLLQPVTREIHERIRLSAALADSLAPLASVASTDPNLAITVLEGIPLIDAAIQNATDGAREEVLTLQPSGSRPVDQLKKALGRAQAMADRGVTLRHIYQHPARYSPAIKAYLQEVPAGHIQVRTIEQTVERLFVFDRTVAFIPASADRDVALEIRHPALVRYLIQVYEVLWAQAKPLSAPLQATAPHTSVTTAQLSVARLLAEGNADQIVARKLGISVRTCRTHISKLMQTLGATSRTHLGALLVQSGIVEGAGK
ncbi:MULTISPECIES: LuxR C-terminal-related transcriptional regulator [unclassified Streptomyces]|uniref:helix-turn-helix transcriptional regulator n=1 Tax=unclassified Streptomyces TaxID=2593676 RepID=UPI0003771FC5|nr:MULTISPECIES: LuxR C-terminal-related transcriptional regulator [unclassified Streptomyces]MYY03384.1 helix-turn-helix transcriptional regulator [Streptomyces sp. SID4913]